jgi:type I restriction enzyme R subunit
MKPEQETRLEIDEKLKKAGWNVTDNKQVRAEFKIRKSPNQIAESKSAYGNQYCDYVLFGKNGKPIAVVEAKKSSQDAAIGAEQAKQYCYALQQQENCDLPFCFYTNGDDIYFLDLENYPQRKIAAFPTREDLEHWQYIRRNRKALNQIDIKTEIVGRDYQIQAIRSVLEGIEKRRRKFLLVMATGTGKTRTIIALVEALMRAGYVERVLFLVDRIALREQALAAFKEHLPDEPRWPNVAEKLFATDRRIYVATHQTMLNIVEDEQQKLSPHFFDLVIVDESHRSIYNIYGEVLNYFNTLTVGLTATPTDNIDRSTFKLFECDNGVPTFAYSYEQAITNTPPYLSDFQVMKLQTRFQLEGINKRTISLEDQKQLLLEGKDIDEINFEGSQLEQIVTNRGTNTLIVREFMEESLKDNDGVLPGKTIFFCISKQHARRMEEIFNQLYPEYKGELAKVIVSDDPRVYGKGGLLDQFVNNDMPRIAISVDMLDTGIDVREIVNLVFAKPVYSYTKFWQMIGRGTRLLEENKLKAWCTEKNHFLILDCWDNFDYFELELKGKEQKTQIPLPVRLVGLRLDKIELALDQSQYGIVENEVLKLREQIATLPQNSIIITEAASLLVHIADEQFWQNLNSEKIAFLRDQIQPLFRAVSGLDFKALSFERDVLQYSLQILRHDEKQAKLVQSTIVDKISTLPLSIHFVQQEEQIIQEAQTFDFWASITEQQLDLLVEKLGPLMRFREDLLERKQITELDFEDSIAVKQKLQIDMSSSAIHTENYRKQVEALLSEIEQEQPVLQRIKQGQPVSDEELEQLSAFLATEPWGIDTAHLYRVYNTPRVDFIHLIRHIFGIETLQSYPEVVNEAFTQFIQQHSTLDSRQLEFLNLLKGFMIERRAVSKKDLIGAPFTVLHSQGIRGLFKPAEIDEILQLTERLAA